MMKKLRVGSVVELIRLVDTASGRWPVNGSGDENHSSDDGWGSTRAAVNGDHSINGR
jgi:hypothetical protein